MSGSDTADQCHQNHPEEQYCIHEIEKLALVEIVYESEAIIECYETRRDRRNERGRIEKGAIGDSFHIDVMNVTFR